MPDIQTSRQNLRLLDDLAEQDTVIHRIHPLAHLLTTAAFIAVVISFGRYSLSAMLPLLFYPVLLLGLGEIPLWPLLKRLAAVSPLIIGIGILNPVFDQQPVLIGTIMVNRGWLTFLVLCFKGGLTVLAALLLIAATGMNNLAAALRILHVPRLLVTQLLLTYRYLEVLAEELTRILQAYSLRAPGQKGVHWRSWGSLAGQLLLRTFDRAGRVYAAMQLRGFKGEYHIRQGRRFNTWDAVYWLGWVTIFILIRQYNWPVLLGTWLDGVIR